MCVCVTAGVGLRLRHTFPQGSIVRGVTTLDSELFVLRMPANGQIEVFGVDDYSLQRRLSVPNLRDAVDMASCSHHHCLYLAGQSLARLLVSFLTAEGRRSPRVPTISIVACPSPTVNTLPLFCLTTP